MRSYSFNLFKFGIFFLASAPFISVLLILLASLLNFKIQSKKYLKDIWTKLFFVSGLLMIISAIYNFRNNPDLVNNGWNKWESFLGLANWIPFFILFPSFQTQLDSSSKREKLIKFLVAGSIPVLITGFAQYIFKIYGPFFTLNKLIIWYMKDTSHIPNAGLSGLFSNQNYAAIWLGHLLPLAVVLMFKQKEKYKKIIVFTIVSLIVACLFLTRSRGVFLSFFLTLNTFLSFKYLLLFAIPAMFIFIFPFISFLPFIPEQLSNFLKIISPNFALQKYSEYLTTYGTLSPRVKIFLNSLQIISKRPLLGWGAFSFPILFYMNGFFIKAEKEVLIQHSHNLILQTALDYGSIVSIMITLVIFVLFIKSGRSIFNNKCSFDLYVNRLNKAWFLAAMTIVINQLFDLTFYDIRINLSGWILLAGLRVIIRENDNPIIKNKGL